MVLLYILTGKFFMRQNRFLLRVLQNLKLEYLKFKLILQSYRSNFTHSSSLTQLRILVCKIFLFRFKSHLQTLLANVFSSLQFVLKNLSWLVYWFTNQFKLIKIHSNVEDTSMQIILIRGNFKQSRLQKCRGFTRAPIYLKTL